MGPTLLQPDHPTSALSTEDDTAAVGGPGVSAQRGRTAPPAVPATRASHSWLAVAPGLAGLVVVGIFIFQNLRSVRISFFTVSGSLPQGLALLLAAVLGAIVVLCLGSVRIIQLRKVARGHYRAAAKAAV
jgi:uncharacterized integral membrane protein